MEGAKVGKYLLGKELGYGASAHVFEAEHDENEQLYAIKVMKQPSTSKKWNSFYGSERR